MKIVNKINVALKDLVFEYFKIRQSGGFIDLGELLSSIKDRCGIGECSGRAFLFPYAEVVGDGMWYVETMRLRRACYPVVLDENGQELEAVVIGQGKWLGEKGAFLCSPTHQALVMLQNKHGVRSTCVGAYFTEIARQIPERSFSGEIRLLGISRSIGASANEMVSSENLGFYTCGAFDPLDVERYGSESAAWMAKQIKNREEKLDNNLMKVCLTPKVYDVVDEKPSMIKRLPGLTHKVEYVPSPVLGNQYLDIEVNDFNMNALTYVVQKPDVELRHMNREMMKAALREAWQNKFFKEYYLNEK